MKKAVFGLMLTLLVLFSFNQLTEAASFQYKEGDVLTTSSTSFHGLTGHSGIVARSADGNLYVVDIPGYHTHIEKLTISTWNAKYPKTEVTRYKDATIAKKAGKKALDFVRYYGGMNGFSAEYSIFSWGALTRTNKDEMYCSKLVWQSYYYGANVNLGFNPYFHWLITPYELAEAPGFSKVNGHL
jgi:uncharacterized protein YycO